MNKIRLSSPADCRGAWFLSAVILLIIVFIVKVLRADSGFVILISICAVITIGIAALYLVAVYKISVEKAGLNKLKINGLLVQNEDYSGAVSIKTVPVNIGPLQSRSITLCDEAGNTVCSISTLFTHHEGVLAEPAAAELAESLGIEFIPTVEKWKYDAQALAQHKAELKRLKMEKRALRRKNKSNNSASATNAVSTGTSEDSINYDRLDDDR